ncbi:MAG: tetratricopeptide repeat protein [Candidatus Korobacteraceae bacterium]
MNRSAKLLLLAAAVLPIVLATGCNKLKARDQLNKGVTSYKNAKYEEAIGHFKESVNLDPELINARLYLATAYAQQYIPGIDTPENNRFGEQAIQEYENVLKADPKNINSVKGIAYLYLQMKRFDDAKKYYRQASDLDPNDPETYYSIAVIDWTQSYQPRMEERAKLGLRPQDPLNDKTVCQQLHDANIGEVDEGVQMLQKALELRPDYDDAMAYLNLLYREKADLTCDNADERAALNKTADDWVEKTMATKKANAEKKMQSAGGITMDSEGTLK